VRAIAICAVVLACGQTDVSPGARAPSGAAGPDGAALPASAAAPDPVADAPPPGLRLPGGIAPLAYDLTLELDPERAVFTGRVAITIAISAPATRLWLHAVDVDIARAALRGPSGDEPVRVLAGGDTQLRGFALPRPLAGTITLVIDYTGRVTDLDGRTSKDEQGLFRERSGGRWYLYSQAESVFARRIVPCFDEPRWKPAWRVTVVVPREQVALGNAAPAAERDLPGGRREIRFAEIAALPSYLLAVAVGPFELIGAGRLGRGRLPVRIAVAPGDARELGGARRALPRLIDALEQYVGAPLPLAKLDLVAVPEFFGAMENPGLITFRSDILVGQRDFVAIAAHELAHQWFGNAVTPAWWDDLWLSEAFASWLGDRVAAALDGPRSPVAAHLARLRALDADDAIDARAMVQPIASPREVEPSFDAVAYDKGAAVLAMFERFAGPEAFQAAVRGYLAAHTGTSVTSQAFFTALASATRRELADALATNLGYAGTPVVELSLRCDAGGPEPAPRRAAPSTATAWLVASARGGVTVPVCVRAAAAQGGSLRSCWLAGAHSEQPLPVAAGCPDWIVGNDGGAGYYRTVWRGPARPAPLALLSPEERLVRGDDAAIATRHGELAVPAALAEITALAASRDPYGELAALQIARAVDPWVGDTDRPRWAAWLAAQLPDRMTVAALLRPRSAVDFLVRGEIVALARPAIAPDVVAAARSERTIAGALDRDPALLAIAGAGDAGALFDRLIGRAVSARSDDERDAALDALGRLSGVLAPRIVGLMLDRRFPADRLWPALAAMLVRGDSRTAAWRAIHRQFAGVFTALDGTAARDALAALAGLCDAGARAQLAAAARPLAAVIPDGRRTLDRTLATIDRCVARRAAAGDIAAALAGTLP